jgi:hypothetical protein
VLQAAAPPVLPGNPNQGEIASRTGVHAAAGEKLDRIVPVTIEEVHRILLEHLALQVF